AATPPPHPAYRMTARISIPAPIPMPAWSNSEIVRLLAMSSPPASPLSPWSSPPSQIPFPPLPLILSPPLPVLSPTPPPSPIRSLGYRAAMIRLRAEVASTSHSPPLQLPSVSRREDRPEVTLPPQKRLGIALGLEYEVGESSSAAAAKPAEGLRADYGFVTTMDREIMRDLEKEVSFRITDSWDEIAETLQGAPVSTDTELGRYMREFETRVRQDTEEIYMRLDDEQKARMSREAWVRSTDASDLVHGEVMSLRTTVLGQMTEIRELHAADRKRQTVISELLRADHMRSTEIIELRTALQDSQIYQRRLVAIHRLDHVMKQMAPKRTTRLTTDQETVNTTSVTNAQLQAMINQGVTAALAARDALRSTNGDDSHNSGTGVRRTERATRESTYTDFFKFKFTICTLHSVALTWWNTHVKTVGHDAAYGMTWKTLIKMMTDKYCPQNEIKKLEMELWDLKVKGTDLASYTQRYQELALLCGRMFSEESNKIEKYIGGLPDMIHESVVAPKPKTKQEAIEIATELMDKKICTFAERETASKRKECPKLKNNNNHGNQGGRNNALARVYAVGCAGTDPHVNVMTGTFLLNNRYASVLFDTGADRSFVSTTFSTQINIMPYTLDHCYDVKLADGRIIGLNTILKGCTLNLLNHPFNINLMPVELGSFDVIISMDWLAKYQAVIVCAEKIVHIPWEMKP
nr:reverse transcriptase domain-containing protein [Tanacetum cinerariifolium]